MVHPMEAQVTVRMAGELLEKLDREAALLHRKRSEVIRLAVEKFLQESGRRVQQRPIDRVGDLLGSFESGIPDLGQRHREHLFDRLRRGE